MYFRNNRIMTLRIVTLFSIFFLQFNICFGEKKEKQTKEITFGDIDTLKLSTSINSDANWLTTLPETTKRVYSRFQNPEAKWKDNAPAIQLLKEGKLERFWFASSRPDQLYGAGKPNNLYQQIYYCEREIGSGKKPSEGWGEIKRWIFKSNNRQLQDWANKFNQANKGAVTICNNRMLFTCTQFETKSNNSNKDLWAIEIKNHGFKGAPYPIEELKNSNTWESQPTISKDGKHLFFVSNRKVNAMDYSIDTETEGTELNIFYSFYNGEFWAAPQLVYELYSEKNEYCPSISPDGKTLYYVANYNGIAKIYERGLQLYNEGGYAMNNEAKTLFKTPLLQQIGDTIVRFTPNGKETQSYPYIYENKANKTCPRAFLWSTVSEKNEDIYACNSPLKVDYEVLLFDKEEQLPVHDFPIVQIKGFGIDTLVYKNHLKVQLYKGMTYQVRGGVQNQKLKSRYKKEGLTTYKLRGYAKSDNLNQISNTNDQPIDSLYFSNAANQKGILQFASVSNQNHVNDTISLSKLWAFESLIASKENTQLKELHQSLSYFQSGFWEVNTSENLNRHLRELHKGFKIKEGGTLYNPKKGIERLVSDYKVDESNPSYPVYTDSKLPYSIANARWIELHPNNFYWGDRPEYSYMNTYRMIGRAERIAKYKEYAEKVDKNLTNFSNEFVSSFLKPFSTNKTKKNQLIVEIVAISDRREVGRGWYIGDTIRYRDSWFNAKQDTVLSQNICIIPPKVNEKTKEITQLLPCSIETNENGNNGTRLGKVGQYTDRNTNLSRLRAWYGYAEIIKRLKSDPLFASYLNDNKVALPTNSIPYEQAEIIVLIHGQRTDAKTGKLNSPYPEANNPNGLGDYSYDNQRKLKMEVRMIERNL